MNKDPFKEYIKESEPSKRDKGYAWHTAIGLQAVDGVTGQEYGVLQEILPTGANDVYRIVSKEGKEYLFPAVPHMIQETDLEGGVIRLLPIPGIFDGGEEEA